MRTFITLIGIEYNEPKTFVDTYRIACHELPEPSRDEFTQVTFSTMREDNRITVPIPSQIISLAQEYNALVFVVEDEALAITGDFSELQYDDILDKVMTYAEDYNKRHDKTIDTGFSVLAMYSPKD